VIERFYESIEHEYLYCLEVPSSFERKKEAITAHDLQRGAAENLGFLAFARSA
jgi:hypothetical protein